MRWYLLTAALIMSSANSAGNLAWFLTARLEPNESTLAGIPLSELDATLKAVKIPTLADLPEGDDIGIADIRCGDVYFDRIEDLTGDGINERVLSGAYLAKDGSTGRFIAIFDWRSPFDPAKLFFHKVPTEPGFAFLERQNGELNWSFCLYCGSFARIQWNGITFEIPPDIGDEGDG